MAEFWKKIKSLFSASEQSSPSQPVIHEVIERTPGEQADYQQWKKTLASRRLLDWLNGQYIAYSHDPEHTDESIDFLNTPSSKGFVIHFHQTRYPAREVTHLFDYLKEKVLDMEYRTYLSDYRTYNRPKWVETVQRHYLKPPNNFRKLSKEKLQQKFGNITIELLFRNEQIHNLKFSATAYRDRLFEDAEEFKKLMQGLMT
ncbi:MAG: hypothetical protein AAGD05_16985 [Bacteroidota bacterium]